MSSGTSKLAGRPLSIKFVATVLISLSLDEMLPGAVKILKYHYYVRDSLLKTNFMIDQR